MMPYALQHVVRSPQARVRASVSSTGYDAAYFVLGYNQRCDGCYPSAFRGQIFRLPGRRWFQSLVGP